MTDRNDVLHRLKTFVAPENWDADRLVYDAAKEIERLRAALTEIASGQLSHVITFSLPPQDPAVNRARAALEGK